jgi:homoserine dehydrogenase
MAEIRGKSLLAAVQPMLVPFSSPLSRTKDSQNALVVTGRHGGETVFSGRGAGGGPTAVAIVSDLLALRRNVTNATGGERLQARRVSGNFSLRHILRFRTPKRSGLPVIIEALSRVGVEVESVLREAKQSKAESFLTLLVKPCRPSTIEDAVREIAGRTHLANTTVYLPILPAS